LQEKEQAEKTVNDFKQRIINDHGLKREQAEAIANAIKLPTKWEQKAPTLKEDVIEFMQLSGGGGSETLKKIQLGAKRAYADQSNQLIKLSDATDRRALFHEMAHHIEFSNQAIAYTSKGWVESRATGEARPLSELSNTGKYRQSEVAIPDKFITPYVGKVYKGYPATEVVSTGVERFSDPFRLVGFAKTDPDHFAYTVGVLASRKP
jgi:hypothetical protein